MAAYLASLAIASVAAGATLPAFCLRLAAGRCILTFRKVYRFTRHRAYDDRSRKTRLAARPGHTLPLPRRFRDLGPGELRRLCDGRRARRSCQRRPPRIERRCRIGRGHHGRLPAFALQWAGMFPPAGDAGPPTSGGFFNRHSTMGLVVPERAGAAAAGRR